MPLPDRLPTVTVTDFGAVVDDGADDTDAFLAALDAVAGGGVLGVPAGTLVLSQRLRLPPSMVLQGAGASPSTLEIPVTRVPPATPDSKAAAPLRIRSGARSSRVGGDVDSEPLTAIVAVAPRGTNTIEVASADGLRVGSGSASRKPTSRAG